MHAIFDASINLLLGILGLGTAVVGFVIIVIFVTEFLFADLDN